MLAVCWCFFFRHSTAQTHTHTKRDTLYGILKVFCTPACAFEIKNFAVCGVERAKTKNKANVGLHRNDLGRFVHRVFRAAFDREYSSRRVMSGAAAALRTAILIGLINCSLVATAEEYYYYYYEDDYVGYENKEIDGSFPLFPTKYERKLAADDSGQYDGFGRSVAVYGDKVLVGAFGESSHATKGGAAYLYYIGGYYPGWELLQKISVNETEQYDYFGWSVSLAAEWMLIGAWQRNDAGHNSGTAYFFRQTSDHLDGGEELWEYFTKFTGWAADDAFGMCVEISDEGYAVVGAPGGTNSAGEYGAGYVSVFTYFDLVDGPVWVETHVLEASQGSKADFFGLAVAIHKTAVVVGAYGFDLYGNNKVGIAVVFELYQDSYAESQILLSSAPRGDDEFGRSVAIWEDVIVVGADGDDSAGSSAGAVFVFLKQNGAWMISQELYPDKSCVLCFYGSVVSIYNNTLAVGMHIGGEAYSSAWIYVRSGPGEPYEKVIQLNSTDHSFGDQFGSALAVTKDILVVGAPTANGYSYGSGAVYVYTTEEAPEDPWGFMSQYSFLLDHMLHASLLVLGAATIGASFIVWKTIRHDFMVTSEGDTSIATESRRGFLHSIHNDKEVY